MELSYIGANCVRITAKDIAILTDPVSAASLGPIKQSADVTLETQAWEGDRPAKAGMIIDGPGEYEVRGAMITGVPARLHIDEPDAHLKGAAYVVQVDGLRTAVVGNVAELGDEAIDGLGLVDVLVLPVGGKGYTLDAEGAAGVISKLEPKLVVPVHYADKAIKYPMPQEELEVFLKEMGASGVEPVAKLKIAAKDLPSETQVVVVSRAAV